MTSKREILLIIGIIAIMAIMLSFSNNIFYPEKLIFALAASCLIIVLSVFVKKITAHYLDVSTEMKLWQFKRYWITERSEFKYPIPIGLIIPILFSFLSGGLVKIFTFMTYESKALSSKAVKKYGLRRFPDIMEWDDALIVFYSTFGILILAVISISIPIGGFSDLARYSIYFSAANLIPFGKLDGMKLFMGSQPLFWFTWLLTLASGLFVFLI